MLSQFVIMNAKMIKKVKIRLKYVKVDARISSVKALIIKVNNNVLVGGKKKKESHKKD